MADYRNSGILNTDGSGTINVGLANNNPGDLKCCDGNNWQGLAGNDGTFDTFLDTVWGIRAIAVDLTTKINKDGLNTITAIISDYAPASDSNNVPAYIAAVSASTGIPANQPLTANAQTMQALVRAIITHEIGSTLSLQYISDADIQQGVSMVGALSPTLLAVSNAAQDNPLAAFVIVSGSVLLLAKLF